MKVAYVTEAFLDRPNGANAHIRGVVEGLREAGCQVLLFLRHGGEDLGACAVPENPVPFLGTVLSQRSMRNAIMKRAVDFAPDIVLGRIESNTLAAWSSARSLGLPFVAELNGDLIEEMRSAGRRPREILLARFVESRVFLHADRIIVNAAPIAQALRARIGVPMEKFEVVPVGAFRRLFDDRIERMAARERLGWPVEARLAVVVGNLRPGQGYEELIEVAAHLRGMEIRIVGDGSLRCQLEAAAGERPVRFSGAVTPDQVPLVLAAADILLLPIRDAPGMAMKLPEYLLSCRPVVADRNYHVARDFHREGLLTLTDFSSPEDTANLLMNLPLDSPETHSQVERGRAYALKHLTWKSIGERLRAILEDSREKYRAGH